MSVTCRFCYKRGHNVKTCPQLTEKVKADPGGYYHRRYSKYFDEQGNRKADSQVKKCSYCKVEGHTKRTCDTKLGDMVHNVKVNQLYRKDVWEWFSQKELGVGSLVTIYKEMYLVTGINWDDFVCGNVDYNRKHLLIQPVTDGYYQRFVIEDDLIRGSKWHKDTIVIESHSKPIPPPEDWFKGNSLFYKDFQGRVNNVLEHKYKNSF